MMATLDKIIIRDFRNIRVAELEFSPYLNCICGDNGQGKTNLLDAVYYLSMTRSFSGVSDSFLKRYGTDGFALAGFYTMSDGSKARFCASVEGGEKTVKRDDKPYKLMSEHMGKLPVVMVSPADSALVSESGEERRRFCNMVLSQLDVNYLLALQRYNRYLAQRNKILKESSPDTSLLDIMDENMSLEASTLCKARRKFAAELSGKAAEYYRRLSQGSEDISIIYTAGHDSDDPSEIKSLFAAGHEKDKSLKYTTFGPQRDDFSFLMNGHPIRKCGSQGQQKSFLVALKLSQYDMMKRRCFFPPILLLDDLFDKLDLKRTTRLLSLVSDEGFGQIFISDSSRERVEKAMSGIAGDARYFFAENGEINEHII